MDFVDRMMGQSSAQRFNSNSLLKFTPLYAPACSLYAQSDLDVSSKDPPNKPAALSQGISARLVWQVIASLAGQCQSRSTWRRCMRLSQQLLWLQPWALTSRS